MQNWLKTSPREYLRTRIYKANLGSRNIEHRQVKKKKPVKGELTFSFRRWEQGQRLPDELLCPVQATGLQVLLCEVVALLRLVFVAIHHAHDRENDGVARYNKLIKISRINSF